MTSSPLRFALDSAIAEAAMADMKISMEDLTVMSPQTDPFRLDTPTNHKIGKWLADTAATLGLGDRRIHNRGLHYMILGSTMPNGQTYVSDDKCWVFLEAASKAARWLGYISFDQITDQRNTAPIVRIYQEPMPEPYITVGIDVEIPLAEDIIPKIGVDDFTGTQPYKLVLVGEKSSLATVLGPIATEYGADLYLPTGDISDTLVHTMARVGSADGRRMIVFYFADADPAGWNMGIVIARKLEALKVLAFPELEFEVRRVALAPDQVREFDLPSTPLKAKEKRAGAWFDAFGVEQTEIDALATLRPNLLRQLAREAIDPFFDATLQARVHQAESRWLQSALDVINNDLDTAALGRIRAEAETKLAAMREQVAAINNALRVDVDEFDLPDILIPAAELTQGLTADPLVDSRWSFADQTHRLLESKAYRSGRAT